MRKVIIIVGKTGSGKSVLSKKLISGCKRVVILDPLSEHEGFPVHSFEEFNDFFVDNQPENFTVCVRFEENDLTVDTKSQYDYLWQALWYIGNVVVVVEEVDAYIPPGQKLNTFMTLIKRGRHKNVSIIGIAQRSPQFSIDLRAQKSTFISFAVDEPTDIDTLKEYGFSEEKLRSLTVEKHDFALIGEPIEGIKFPGAM